MLISRFLFYFISTCILFTVTAHSQTVEEEERETLRHGMAQPTGQDTEPDPTAVARLIVNRTNEFRHNEGSQEVGIDPNLRKTAQYFAHFMARTDEYGHTADGNRPAQRAKQCGYDYCIVSENIATVYSSAGFTTEELARQFFRGWQHSPGHRKNMLAPAVSDTSVTIARSKETGYYYAVQMFGRPKSERLIFQVTNHANATVTYEIGDRTFPLPPRYTRTHQRCRPTQLTFHWPDEKESTTVQPATGDQVTIKREDDGEFLVTTE